MYFYCINVLSSKYLPHFKNAHILFSSSRTAPPRLTDSQGLAQEVEVEGAVLGMIQMPRGPPNASMCPTSPSASETQTYDRCLGYVA